MYACHTVSNSLFHSSDFIYLFCIALQSTVLLQQEITGLRKEFNMIKDLSKVDGNNLSNIFLSAGKIMDNNADSNPSI